MMRRSVHSPRLLGACVLVAGLAIAAAAEPPEQMDFADGLFSRGLYDMAAAEYRSLIESNPAFDGRDAALFRLAECHRNLGSKVDAERVYHRLMTEFELSQEQIAVRVGKSRSAVANFLRLRQLPAAVKQGLIENTLTTGHARALLAITGSLKQTQAAKTVVSKGLSVRQTEALVKRLLEAKTSAGSSGVSKDRDIMRLEKEVGEKLGAKVAIQHGAKGKGKLVISYNSTDELDGILQHIK